MNRPRAAVMRPFCRVTLTVWLVLRVLIAVDVPVVSVVDEFTDVVVCHVKASPACTTLPLTTSTKQCVVSRTCQQWPVPCMARNVSIASLRL